MKNLWLRVSTLGLLGLSSVAFAGGPEMAPPAPMNQTGFFMGLGGSYNSVRADAYSSAVGSASLDANVSADDVSLYSLAASASASGTGDPIHHTTNTFAPEAQIGYFQHFTGSNWLWGVKFMYKYLQATSTTSDPTIPLDLDNVSVQFTDNVDPAHSADINADQSDFGDDVHVASIVGSSAQTSVNHELALMAFIGRSFANSFIYLGVGPSLFGTQTNIYNAAVTGPDGAVSAELSDDLSSKKWMWGGAVQVGMAYYFNPTWFLDLSYTYAITSKYGTSFAFSDSSSDSFTHTHDEVTYDVDVNAAADASASINQRVTAQEFVASINKVFSV